MATVDFPEPPFSLATTITRTGRNGALAANIAPSKSNLGCLVVVESLTLIRAIPSTAVIRHAGDGPRFELRSVTYESLMSGAHVHPDDDADEHCARRPFSVQICGATLLS
jgi:hypothetical protein